MNGRRIHVSPVDKLRDSLMCTGFPNKDRHTSINIYFYHQLAMTSHGVRRSGSAAVDLANVACGRLEGFWEFGLNPWDLAAGKLLVAEAGGMVTDMKGGPHSMPSESIAATNGVIHPETLALFEEIFSGKLRNPLPVLRPID